jgi:hypothetical protein
MALGLAEFVAGLLSFADRDLLAPRSVEVVLARALRELALFSSRTNFRLSRLQQIRGLR